ncbi:MAG: ABC transporter transmembrane domain-containing protein, partial [Niameybacter sp.]
MKDYQAKQLVGSGLFIATVDEEERMICGFKPKWFKRYVELAKLLEYYNKSGKHTPYEEDQEEYMCPKCGFPLLNGSKMCFKCQSKVKVLMKIFKIGKEYKKVFLYSLIGTLITEMLWIVNPYIMRVIIDDYIVPKNANIPDLVILLLVYLTVFVTITICERFVMKFTNVLSNSISRDLRNQVFMKIQELSLSTVSKRTPGELMNRINSDTEKIQEFISNYGRDAINRIFSLIVLTILLFVMDYRLALLVLIPLPPVLYAVTKMQDKMGLRYWKQWRKHEKASSVLHDILSGIRVVKAYGNEQIEIDKYTQHVDQVKESMISAETLWSKFYPYIGYLMGMGEFLVLWLGGYLVLGGKMQLGQLIQYTTYITMIYVPLRWAIQLPRVFADVFVSAGKVFELLEENCEMEEIDEPIKKEIVGDVVFDIVGFGYKVYEPVLKYVSFEVKAGEMIGIVGHSGAGKSTLINLLMRLYDVADGQIKIDGIDIREFSQQA